MAAVAVLAELRLRDGHREKICVKVENNLSSLISGIHQLNADASRLLSELVERENPRGPCAEQGQEEEESDEEEERQNSQPQPPAKRSKT
ncbi:uncharacterized protein si:dkeyp-55f12.3 isoform X2 [Sander lucioperca]|uniref:uncharacterized protein si:dkeyp-55f12.3 isoform X2 n=1 Tax=Sander lucioperca TaxID=283035 RepID=UPI001653D7F6|nr:uncharacterized protein si:dkeyp-55f12.3 isoform X2 [Sander lucioperca]